MENLKKGDLVVYEPTGADGAIYKRSLGVVKEVREGFGTAFVAYHCGDTCACTPLEHLHKVDNPECAKALVQRMEQLGAKSWPLSDGYDDWGRDAE